MVDLLVVWSHEGGVLRLYGFASILSLIEDGDGVQGLIYGYADDTMCWLAIAFIADIPELCSWAYLI